MSNIRFQYGVFVILTYSFPFSWLSFVFPSRLWQSASKSNCHCKLQVTIRFILFHNPFFFRVCRSLCSLYGFNCLDLQCFLTYLFQLKSKPLFWTPSSTIWSMENAKNPLISINEKERESPKDGCQMVDVAFIPP